MSFLQTVQINRAGFSLETLLFFWIPQDFPLHPQKRGQRMLSGGALVHDVEDVPAIDGERIGDQGPVTAPGHRFGAHDGGVLTMSAFFKLGQARAKGRGRHIVSVPTKGGVAPAGVRRILPRMAQATERFQMKVADASALEGAGKLITAKLGMRPRPGNRAHVYQELDRVYAQEF